MHCIARVDSMLCPDGSMANCTEAISMHLKAGTRIKLQGENPKTKNTLSYSRYEKYKTATSFQDMFDRGARWYAVSDYCVLTFCKLYTANCLFTQTV